MLIKCAWWEENMKKRFAAVVCAICLLPGCTPQYVVRTGVDTTAARTFVVQRSMVRGSATDQENADRNGETGIARQADAITPEGIAPMSAKVVAALSLLLWFGVIFFGRFIMYNDTLLYALGL
jgi:hypothetical protein